MFIPDMAPQTYSLHKGIRVLSVGWLGSHVPRRGVVPPAVMQVLKFCHEHHYFEDNLLGSHTCEICGASQFHGEFLVEAGDTTFVLPVGVFHYIQEHGYCPPYDFLVAIAPPGIEVDRASIREVGFGSWIKQFMPR